MLGFHCMVPAGYCIMYFRWSIVYWINVAAMVCCINWSVDLCRSPMMFTLFDGLCKFFSMDRESFGMFTLAVSQ